MKDGLESLARWPLLLGAIILFSVGLWEASHEGGGAVGLVAATVGCVLLGAWIWSLAIESERRHRDRKNGE